MKSFSASVGAWGRKTERRLELIHKESAQRVFNKAQTPRAKGGLLPIDTGFLRASGVGALNTMPSGPSDPSEGINENWEGVVSLVIDQASPSDVIFLGWSANYARLMEERYGFMKTAAGQWPQIVRGVVQEAKARVR